MINATRVTVSAFGALAGLAGIEHGVGEILQGNVASEGLVMLSWAESETFRVLGGEPAMTIIPSLFAAGIASVLVSSVYLVWATVFVARRHAGLALMLLSGVMLLVGAGFGPPMLGILVGLAATRINAPLVWWRACLSPEARQLLVRLWPWCFVTSIGMWLSLLPGTILLDRFVGLGDPELVVSVLTISAFGSFLLTVIAAFGHDVQRRISTEQTLDV